MATFFDYIFLLNEINQAEIKRSRITSEIRSNLDEISRRGLIDEVPESVRNSLLRSGLWTPEKQG